MQSNHTKLYDSAHHKWSLEPGGIKVFTITRGHSPLVMAAHKTVTSCEQAQ